MFSDDTFCMCSFILIFRTAGLYRKLGFNISETQFFRNSDVWRFIFSKYYQTEVFQFANCNLKERRVRAKEREGRGGWGRGKL